MFFLFLCGIMNIVTIFIPETTGILLKYSQANLCFELKGTDHFILVYPSIRII